MDTAIFRITFVDGCWMNAELPANPLLALAQAKFDFGSIPLSGEDVVRCERVADSRPAALRFEGVARTKLMRWIDSHYPAAPTVDNGDGTLTVASEVVDADGILFIERDVIPATMKAARDLLGY